MIVYDKETATCSLTMVFPYSEALDKVRAKIALFSHNLAPDADAVAEEFSWHEERDEPLLKFTHLCALERVTERLSAWGAKLLVADSSASIVLSPSDSGAERLEALLHSQIADIVLNAMLADKLMFSARELRTVAHAMRQEFLQRVQHTMDDMVCSMSIFQPA